MDWNEGWRMEENLRRVPNSCMEEGPASERPHEEPLDENQGCDWSQGTLFAHQPRRGSASLLLHEMDQPHSSTKRLAKSRNRRYSVSSASSLNSRVCTESGTHSVSSLPKNGNFGNSSVARDRRSLCSARLWRRGADEFMDISSDDDDDDASAYLVSGLHVSARLRSSAVNLEAPPVPPKTLHSKSAVARPQSSKCGLESFAPRAPPPPSRMMTRQISSDIFSSAVEELLFVSHDPIDLEAAPASPRSPQTSCESPELPLASPPVHEFVLAPEEQRETRVPTTKLLCLCLSDFCNCEHGNELNKEQPVITQNSLLKPTHSRGSMVTSLSESLQASVIRNLKPRKNRSVIDFYSKRGLWQRIAKNPWYETCTNLLVCFNAIWLAYDADRNTSIVMLESDIHFQVMDQFFCCYFALEVTIRLMAFEHRPDCFRDPWLCFEGLLVILVVLDTWIFNIIIVALGSFGGGTALKFGTLLRLIRLIRLSKFLRLLRSMPELLSSVKGLVVAVPSVFFVTFLLFMLTYITSIAFVQISGIVMLAEEDHYFQDIPTVMVHLFWAGMMLDNISVVLNDMSELSALYFVMYLVYTTLAALMLLNVLVGVLCEVISEVTEREKAELDVEFIMSRMKRIVDKLDTDKDDQIGREEFAAILQIPEAIAALEETNVDPYALIDNIDVFFRDRDGERRDLDLTEVADAIIALKNSNVLTVTDSIALRLSVEERLGDLEELVSTIQLSNSTSKITLDSKGGGKPGRCVGAEVSSSSYAEDDLGAVSQDEHELASKDLGRIENEIGDSAALASEEEIDSQIRDCEFVFKENGLPQEPPSFEEFRSATCSLEALIRALSIEFDQLCAGQTERCVRGKDVEGHVVNDVDDLGNASRVVEFAENVLRVGQRLRVRFFPSPPVGVVGGFYSTCTCSDSESVDGPNEAKLSRGAHGFRNLSSHFLPQWSITLGLELQHQLASLEDLLLTSLPGALSRVLDREVSPLPHRSLGELSPPSRLERERLIASMNQSPEIPVASLVVSNRRGRGLERQFDAHAEVEVGLSKALRSKVEAMRRLRSRFQ